ncbi:MULTISPECIES: biotin-dependent carboxyltransferase family protein [unclassified Agarivorans]|uniref:5-oxoprolinase subunit C family protein n=1 Tax=unclassified Agarivorans TaxID=2636026 RepID=UPI0026E2415D|nr:MULTISPECIES: biotin-dependent carboxyltransferase family protein [unclassified Agarivorans]MDO6685030.1 biotin-dependent carboxyltransferase family protein [Agarivorans sp. 3_MG-2023]MDO6717412.1 biotin-dependent carboxyltransferase family protein [Agarivorans sp. 2_MG-2023]
MSSPAAMNIIRSGPHTLVVDQGRFGYQDIGVSPGGPADLHAYYWANRLLGNSVNCAALEVTIGGAQFQFSHSCTIAVCGAKMPITVTAANTNTSINLATWRTIKVNAGDRLSLAPARSGLRSYLAISGGFSVRPELGSVSSSIKQKLGAFNGRLLAAGDKLEYITSCQHPALSQQQVPNRFLPDYQQTLKLALIPSYQFQQFTQKDIDTLRHQTYTLSELSDRMGLRLVGDPLVDIPPSGESEAIALGAVQVPPNGLPIVLSVDKQTIGGYPKLGCIARLDLYALNQRRPQQAVQFYISSWQAQRQRWLAFQQFFSIPLGVTRNA